MLNRLLMILIIDGPIYHTGIRFESSFFYTASSTIYCFPRIFVGWVCAVATTITHNFSTLITIQCRDWMITGKNYKDTQMWNEIHIKKVTVLINNFVYAIIYDWWTNKLNVFQTK